MTEEQADSSQDLEILYSKRFDGNQTLHKRNIMWKYICKYFLQRFIPQDAKILDIASGYCEFINNIEGSEKYAIDLNPDSINFADDSVKVIQEDILDIKTNLPMNHFDIVFISNFLEHLDSKEDVKRVINKSKQYLNEDGKIIILQPNIRYVKGRYWDFFDHKTPLTEKSLIECANILNLKVVKCYKRTLPYTQKSKIPVCRFLIIWYCKLMPISSFFFGAQSLLILKK